MFTILADAMYAATLARRGSNIPDHLKDHAERHVPQGRRKPDWHMRTHHPYRDLW